MNYNTLDPKQTLSFDLQLNETTIAWIAGILEGEATFGNDQRIRIKNKNATPPTPYINLRMSDKDVVQKFADCVKKKVNQLRTPKNPLAKKTMYSCYVGDRGTMYYFLNKILPYMGNTRTKQIKQQLQYIEEWKEWYYSDGRSRAKFNILKQEAEQVDQIEQTGENLPEQ